GYSHSALANPANPCHNGRINQDRRHRRSDGTWRSLASALAWGARGRGFKSRRPDSSRKEALLSERSRRRVFLFEAPELRHRGCRSNTRFRDALRRPPAAAPLKQGRRVIVESVYDSPIFVGCLAVKS